MTSVRTTRSTVRFEAPFKLACLDEALPAGTYDIDAEEEVVEGNQRNTYVRVAMLLHLRSRGMVQILPIHPRELQAAITIDASLPKGDSFGPATGEDRLAPSYAASERDLGSVGAVEVAAMGTETLRIVQAMQDQELTGIVQRMKDSGARQEIEQAALLELERRGPKFMTASAQKEQSGSIRAASTEQGGSDLITAQVGAHFEVYRVDETHVSAMRWLGGEWRWRLFGSNGETLALSCQYPTSDACLKAVHALRNCAGAADIVIAGGPKK